MAGYVALVLHILTSFSQPFCHRGTPPRIGEFSPFLGTPDVFFWEEGAANNAHTWVGRSALLVPHLWHGHRFILGNGW